MPDELNPYTPPLTSPEPTEISCPKCSALMQHGDLISGSTIRWQSSDASGLQRFLSGGEKIGNTRSGLGYRVAAYYCRRCQVIMLKP